MAGMTEEQLRDLRQRYQAAYTAYQSCVDALTKMSLKGEKPPAELWEKEAAALRELNEARAAYRDALLEIGVWSRRTGEVIFSGEKSKPAEAGLSERNYLARGAEAQRGTGLVAKRTTSIKRPSVSESVTQDSLNQVAAVAAARAGSFASRLLLTANFSQIGRPSTTRVRIQ